MPMFLISATEAVNFNPGGRFHGWLFRRHPDGQFVSVRKLQEVNPFPIGHPLTELAGDKT